MSKRGTPDAQNDELGLGENPLGDVERDPLAETFYAKSPRAKRAGDKKAGRQPLKDGQSYRLVTFSFYEEDVARLDALLEIAKQHGHKRVSRSQIVRLALRQVDVKHLPEII